MAFDFGGLERKLDVALAEIRARRSIEKIEEMIEQTHCDTPEIADLKLLARLLRFQRDTLLNPESLSEHADSVLWRQFSESKGRK